MIATKKLTIRLKENDYLKLCVQCNELNKSQNEVIRELIRKDFIGDIKDYNSFLKDIFYLYKNISNNLNQISKKINLNIISGKDIKKEIDKIWHLLSQLNQ